jgi:hypothetical protein
MGQISIKILCLPRSVLGENQQADGLKKNLCINIRRNRHQSPCRQSSTYLLRARAGLNQEPGGAIFRTVTWLSSQCVGVEAEYHPQRKILSLWLNCKIEQLYPNDL